MGLIGSAIGAAGAIFGGLKASEAMKNVANSINDQMKDNQAWYDRRYNEDATQRADAQRLLQMTEESIKKRNRQAAGTAAALCVKSGRTPRALDVKDLIATLRSQKAFLG